MKQEMTGWQWHQLDHMKISCTLLQTDNHANTSSCNFLQAECSSSRPTNSVKTVKAILLRNNVHVNRQFWCHSFLGLHFKLTLEHPQSRPHGLLLIYSFQFKSAAHAAPARWPRPPCSTSLCIDHALLTAPARAVPTPCTPTLTTPNSVTHRHLWC